MCISKGITNFWCKFCCDLETLERHYFINHKHCMKCDKTFDRNASLFEHLLEVHQKLVKCPHCAYFDFNSTNLNLHIQTHTNPLPKLKNVKKEPREETYTQAQSSQNIKIEINVNNQQEFNENDESFEYDQDFEEYGDEMISPEEYMTTEVDLPLPENLQNMEQHLDVNPEGRGN